MTEKVVYKIYYPDKDEYAVAGGDGFSSKQGKIWQGKGNLNKHLAMRPRHPENAEVHVYRLVMTPVGTQTLKEYQDARNK